jgi:hypothetical protein
MTNAAPMAKAPSALPTHTPDLYVKFGRLRHDTAAHPSSVKIVQSQADDMVTDLINNVVVALT